MNSLNKYPKQTRWIFFSIVALLAGMILILCIRYFQSFPEETVYFASVLITIVVTGFLAFYAWQHRHVTGAISFMAMELSQSSVALCEGLSMVSRTQSQASFWFDLRFIGIACGAVFWLIFALEYTGRKDWLSRRMQGILFIIPFVTQVMIWISPLRKFWVEQGVGFHQTGPFWIAETTVRIPGVWFLIHSVYAVILLLVGTLLVFVAAWRLTREYRGQAFLLIGGAFVPCLIAVIPTFNLNPAAKFNPLVQGMALGAALIAAAVFRFQFLANMPVVEPDASTRALGIQFVRFLVMFISVFVLLAIGLTVTGYVYYRNYEKQIRAQTESQLSAIAQLKVNELVDWRTERIADGIILVNNSSFAALVQACLENPSDTRTQAEIQVWLDNYQMYGQYDRVRLLDIHGKVLLSSPKGLPSVAPAVAQSIPHVLQSKQVTLVDFYRDATNGRVYMTVLIPVLDANAESIGIVSLRVDPSLYLYPYIKEWPTPSTSAETLLVRRDGNDVLFLNDLKFEQDAALNLRFPLTDTDRPAVKAVLGEVGIRNGVDYRGVPVISYLQPVPDSPWYLVARMDLAEVYAPVQQRLWQTIIFFGMLILASGTGLTLLWRQQQLRYYRSQVETLEALRSSEEKFRLAFDTSPDALTITRLSDHKFVSANLSFEQMTGYSKADIIGKTSDELNLWKDPKIHQVLVRELQEKGEVRNYETSILTKSGQLYCLMSASFINVNGEPHILTMTIDISERKRAEDALRESEEKYRLLTENMKDVVWTMDAETMQFLYISPSVEKLRGYTPQEIIAEPVNAALTPEAAKFVQSNIDKQVAAIHAGTASLDQFFTSEVEQPCKDGTKVWTEVISNYYLNEKTGHVEVRAVTRDISERKKAENALRQSEENFSKAFRSSPAALLITRLTDGRFMELNEAYSTIVGYRRDELIDHLTTDFNIYVHSTDRQAIVDRLLAKGSIHDFETSIRNRSGAIRHVVAAQELTSFNGEACIMSTFLDITERKQAEETARQYTSRLEEAERHATLGSWEFDAITGQGWWSKQMYRMFYMDIADSVPDFETYLERIHPQDRPIVQDVLAKMSEGREPLCQEFRTNPEFGPMRYFIPTVYTERDANGNPVKFIGTQLDITERKKTEQEIRQRITELEMLYESGLALNQLLSQKEIGQKIIELLEQKMDWHHTIIRLYRPQDETLVVLAFSQPDVNGENEIRQVKEQLDIQISNVDKGLTGWAVRNSQIVRSGALGSDPRYAEMFPDMQSGLYVPMKLGERVVGVISIESEKPHAFTVTDERLVATLANQAAVAFENAQLYQTAQEEIIERKRIETLLEEERNLLAHRVEQRTADLSRANVDLAHALRVKDEFLASMSHELRTPLTGILGLSEALQAETYGELNDKQYKVIRMVEDSGQHLLELINDILDLSKIEAGKLELQLAPCSLGDICMASLELIKGMAGQKHQHVQYSIPAEPIILLADARRLKQSLVNLFSNAIKFTPEHGDLGLEVQVDQDGKVVRLIVWDKGIGVKPEDMHKLFKPFTQIDSSLSREYSGTGLGLSLVHRLVELHNGHIEMESVFGEGSRFIITLPWSPKNEGLIPTRPGADRQHSPQVTLLQSISPLIMIVDDNEILLDMMSDFLEAKQYRTAKIDNGAELLEKITTAGPDLILMDIQMPEMDGLETIRRIRSHPDPVVAATPVIAVTALAMTGDRERCLAAGANDYMSKPVKLMELIDVIKKRIKESRK
jgi:PAS domain S-box-containing protein